ncbi:hypothetical protein DTO027I6_9861 [Penicillium roqueforti]|nr:hypothetical protein CBS147337_10311 [Penicillium roqueforti]KAI3185257.1 hypothetical protein DTO027I6_9861 [Penicillium roqueforti]
MKHKRSADATRKRLTATSRKDRRPAVSDTVNRQDRVLVTPMRNRHSNAGIIQAPNTALIAPSEETFSPISGNLLQPKNRPPPIQTTKRHQPRTYQRTMGALSGNSSITPGAWNITFTDIQAGTLPTSNEWKRQISNKPTEQVTFGTLCTFLIHQLQIGVSPEVARARYVYSYQRPFQSVTDFSNWMQQWEPHFHKSLSERDRMRHLFEHLSNKVHEEADKTYLDFTHYYDLVVYLQRIEDCIHKRAGPLRKKFSNPGKRPHTGS